MAYIIRGANVGGGANVYSANYVSVSVDLSATTWKSVASHEVFTVTGLVRAVIWIECTETVTGGAGITIQFGVEGATDAIIGSTDATALAANDLWYDATPATVYDTSANVIMDYVINGLDIGYEIGTDVSTDGTLVFHCVWEPLNSTGNLVAGAGGSL